MNDRIIHRVADRPQRAIAEALESLALAEIVAPGRRFIAVSPWITDFPLIDNRSGSFSALDHDWGATRITFSMYLRALLRRGVSVWVACGTDDAAVKFVQRVTNAARQDGTAESLTTRISQAADQRLLQHEKALVADTWAVHGSMNLTYRGIEVNGELVTISQTPDHVAQLAATLMELF